MAPEVEVDARCIAALTILAKEETARMPAGLTREQHHERLRGALYAAFDDEARARILREESLAWELGHEALKELGLNNLGAYDERTKNGLHKHR